MCIRHSSHVRAKRMRAYSIDDKRYSILCCDRDAGAVHYAEMSVVVLASFV